MAEEVSNAIGSLVVLIIDNMWNLAVPKKEPGAMEKENRRLSGANRISYYISTICVLTVNYHCLILVVW
jgi:hypothetical protein